MHPTRRLRANRELSVVDFPQQPHSIALLIHLFLPSVRAVSSNKQSAAGSRTPHSSEIYIRSKLAPTAQLRSACSNSRPSLLPYTLRDRPASHLPSSPQSKALWILDFEFWIFDC